MNIAVDFDGVLFDTELWFMTYGNIYNLEIGGNVVDEDAIWVQDRYDWEEKQIRDFIERTSFQIEEKAPVMPFAKEVLEAIAKNNKLFAISNRGGLHEGEQEVTLKRLKKENITFDKVMFKQSSKVLACKENNIDLIIEDHPNNIKELAKNGIKCLYFRDLTTQKIKHKNVIEVRNWGEVAIYLIKFGIIKKEDLKIEFSHIDI